MNEIKIDAQVVNGEPYVSLLDLIEWMVMINEEVEAKGADTEVLVAVIHNLHDQCVALRKQIADSKRSAIMNVKEDIEEAKKVRDADVPNNDL
jgi:hypothetical protein